MYPGCCLLAPPLGRCSGKKACGSFLLFCGACLSALVLSAMEKFKLKCKGIFSSIGCLGSCTKPPVIGSMDEASKGLRNQGQTVTKDDGSSDFWSSNTIEMDHNAAQSLRSVSSTATSNYPSDPQSSACSQTAPPEFVNHGLLHWYQMRQQWVGNKTSESQTEVREPKIR